MANAIADAALDVIFREARTHFGWLPRPIDDDLLRRVYDLAKMGPTSANTSPMRVVFVKTPAAKERLKPALIAGNVAKTMAAPVCAIVANDLRFYEYVPRLYPQNPKFAELFTAPGKEEFARTHVPQRHASGGLLDHGGARPGFGLRADVRFRQCQGGRGVFPGRPLQV
jgi:nitroreductase